MARLFDNSHTIDSPQRAAALSIVLALHAGAVVALAQYRPARVAQVMSDAAKYGLSRIGFVTGLKERS